MNSATPARRLLSRTPLRISLTLIMALGLALVAMSAFTGHSSNVAHASATSCPYGNAVPITSSTKQSTVIPTTAGGHHLTVTLHAVLWGVFADQGDGPFCNSMYGTVTATYNSCDANSFDCNNRSVTASTYLVYRLSNGAYIHSPTASDTGPMGYDNPLSVFPPLTARTVSVLTTCGAVGGDLYIGGTDYIHVGTANQCP